MMKVYSHKNLNLYPTTLTPWTLLKLNLSFLFVYRTLRADSVANFSKQHMADIKKTISEKILKYSRRIFMWSLWAETKLIILTEW